jgi:tRNA nucleotidyltransferase/poly(A) polymerase
MTKQFGHTDSLACSCSSLEQEQRRKQHPPRRRKTRAESFPYILGAPTLALCLLHTVLLWSAQAFTTMPRVPPILTRTLPKESHRAAGASPAGSLAAINSRELRFHSGSKVSQEEKEKAALVSSLPEVLVASMSHYFFSSPAARFILNGDSRDSRATALMDEDQRMHSSPFTSITSTSTITTTSTTTVLAHAPPSALMTQHNFRSSSSRSGGGGSNPEESDAAPRAFRNTPDDNTSPLLEKGESIYSSSLSGQYPPPRQGYGYSIQLTDDEKALFRLLRRVHEETNMTTTLRVAGGWVRDKLLATPEFQIFHHYNFAGTRLTKKFKQHASPIKSVEQPSMGRQGTKILSQDDNGPVDIDIALDTMLGREFADHLNGFLKDHGEDTVSVGVVLKNPEKSKHLETATMKVGSFWIDFVNLRAEEYAEDSRIPDLMRIGTAKEDAFRRDLTINSLFFNVNTGQVEDWTGRGFADLRRGIVATPLAPLTTLLDDPLRVLRSVRFAARLRFNMDDELVEAAKDDRVRIALEQKVSRERVGGEVDLMLRSPDPVGAMRLLSNLNLIDTVFPVAPCFSSLPGAPTFKRETVRPIFDESLTLLSTTHDHLFDCKVTPPCWCKTTSKSFSDIKLTEDEEARRLLWYAALMKPINDRAQHLRQQLEEPEVSKRAGKKANRSIMSRLLVDELKRPSRDAELVEKIIKGANDITKLIQSGCDVSATLVLLSEVKVLDINGITLSSMRGRPIDSISEEDPVWQHAMEFRLLCSKMLKKVGVLWRAALMLSLSEQLAHLNDEDHLDYTIEGDVVCLVFVYGLISVDIGFTLTKF